MKSRLLTCVVLVTMLGFSGPAQAGGLTTGLREFAEYVGKKVFRDVAEEGAERVATRLTRQAAKEGDAAAIAILKHGTVGEQLIGQFGKDSAEALARVAPQNGRRLAMLAAQGQLEPGLMDVIARHGDQACEFIWRNKGALAVGTTLTAFVANPEPFINGTEKLAATVADAAVKPIAVGVAENTNWTVIGVMVTAMVAIAGYLGVVRIARIPASPGPSAKPTSDSNTPEK
jgi:hypothetical protein